MRQHAAGRDDGGPWNATDLRRAYNWPTVADLDTPESLTLTSYVTGG